MTMPLLAASVLLQLVSSHPSSAPAHPPVASSASSATSAGGLTWTVPKGFTTVPSPSAMRLATYKVGDAELAVFFFGPGQGGDVASNVARWQSQLAPEGKGTPPPAKKIDVGGIAVTLVTAEGTYSSGMPGGGEPKKGYALSGAIAEGPQGGVFFKLVGPKKTVAAAGADFDALVKSIKKG